MYEPPPSTRAEYDSRSEADTSKIPVQDITSVLAICKAFRILVIGKAGVGKSTIASRVFSVPYVDVRTKITDIYEELKWPAINDQIIIHDSGGFEAGDGNKTVDVVRDFINKRRQSPDINEQIHCIWYCISCTEQRPYQEAENFFFQQMDTGRIPVVVVFTKYDMLRQQVGGELDEDGALDGLTKEQARKQVEAKTQDRFEHQLLRPLQTLIGSRSIRFERVSKPPRKRQEVPGLSLRTDMTGVKKLVGQTHEVLKQDGLKFLFAAAQRYDADTKLEDSLETILRVFWRTQGWGFSIIVPGITAAAMRSSFSEAYNSVKKQWAISTEPKNLLDDTNVRWNFYYGAFDVDFLGKIGLDFLQSLDILGPITSVVTAQRILTYIGCVTLMFERLFWLQKDINAPLRKHDIEQVVRDFRTSEKRRQLVHYIRGELEFFSTKHFRKAECQGILTKGVSWASSERYREYTQRKTVGDQEYESIHS